MSGGVMPTTAELHGLMAEFATPDELVHAAERVTAEGYRKVEAYSPLPVHGLAEALRQDKTWLPAFVLAGGLSGATFGYGLCYWMTVLSYPHNVGGRPLYSWPAYIPITFECTVLFAGLTAAITMLLMNGLPRPYHPVFNVPRFARASQDRFFLCVEAEDPRFDGERVRRLFDELHAREVSEVEK